MLWEGVAEKNRKTVGAKIGLRSDHFPRELSCSRVVRWVGLARLGGEEAEAQRGPTACQGHTAPGSLIPPQLSL